MPENGKNNSAHSSNKTINCKFKDYMHHDVGDVASEKRWSPAHKVCNGGIITIDDDISLPSFQLLIGAPRTANSRTVSIQHYVIRRNRVEGQSQV